MKRIGALPSELRAIRSAGRRPWLLAAGFLMAAASLQAAVLAKPEGLSVSAGASGVRIEWQPVDSAALYRVAVFDAPGADDKRPLLAAVWVRGRSWDYGKGPVLARVGRLPSTPAQALPLGHRLRVMVAAAREDGSDKSDWSGTDLLIDVPPKVTPLPSALPTAVEPQLLPTAPTSAANGDAELSLEGGDEFKSSPEPAEIELDEEATPEPSATPTPLPLSPESAAAELKAGHLDAAEAQYRGLIKAQGDDADLWEGLGDVMVARRMKAEALEAYSKALQLDHSRERLKDWVKVNAPRR